MKLDHVCVYCASSRKARPEFLEGARTLGSMFARAGIGVVYGGGKVGLMGALADGALAAGGEVVGIIPEFMKELEWAHDEVTHLEVVPDMHTRKRMMIERADAIVALPGGTGTLEELLEAITWKRLAIHLQPIVVANLGGYYDAMLAQLQTCIDENLMDPRHLQMWTSVSSIDEVIPALRAAEPWDEKARGFANV